MVDASVRARLASALAALAIGLAGAPAAGAQASAASAADTAPAVAAASAASSASGSASASASTDAKRGAPQAVPTAADPALEARMLAITGELRCLVCQNQTIADSHADLAVDLRQEVRELLKQGRSDAQIRRYMTDRYGDFVLYNPPFKPSTIVLWLGPALLLAVALIALMVVIARRGKLGDDAFEPDPDWRDDDADLDVLPTTARPGTPA